MGLLSDTAWRRAVELFLLAKEHDEDGTLPDMRTISYRLHVSQTDLEKQFQPLLDEGILTRDGDDLIVTNFAKRQAPDSPADRSRRYNATRARRERDASATQRDASATIEREIESIERESEIDIERDREYTSLNSLSLEFSTATGIHRIEKTAQRWDAAIAEIASSGARPGDVERCCEELRKKGFNITGPWSISRAINSIIARRNNGNGNGHKSESTRIVVPEGWTP